MGVLNALTVATPTFGLLLTVAQVFAGEFPQERLTRGKFVVVQAISRGVLTETATDMEKPSINPAWEAMVEIVLHVDEDGSIFFFSEGCGEARDYRDWSREGRGADLVPGQTSRYEVVCADANRPLDVMTLTTVAVAGARSGDRFEIRFDLATRTTAPEHLSEETQRAELAFELTNEEVQPGNRRCIVTGGTYSQRGHYRDLESDYEFTSIGENAVFIGQELCRELPAFTNGPK